MAVDIHEAHFKVWPSVDVNGYWKYAKKKEHILYVGLNSWFELDGLRAHGERQPYRYIPSLQAGHTFHWKKWDLQTEFKYQALNIPSQNLVVDYKGGKVGVPAIYLGVTRRF